MYISGVGKEMKWGNKKSGERMDGWMDGWK